MDRKNQLILHNGKDITDDVKDCVYNQATKKYDITFKSGRIYNYNFSSIELVKNPKLVDPEKVRITTQAGNEINSCIDEENAKNCMSYLRELAAVSELKNDMGEALLSKQ